MFDFLVPELFASDGGIQAYSRALIFSFAQAFPLATVRVFILNDSRYDIPAFFYPNVQLFPCGRRKSLFVGQIFSKARRAKPRLIVSTHINFAPLLVFHKRVFGSPVWCSAHGIEIWDLKSSIKLTALSQLDLILPVSEFTAERIRVQLGHLSPRLFLLPNTFDSSRFYPGPKSELLLRRYGISPATPIILTLTRLTFADRYKNVDSLIDSLSYLLPKWPSLRLIICGDGDDLPRLRQLSATRNVERSVLFAGRLSPSDTVEHLRLASVFALPSTGEGFGIVFLEALGCGIPTLAGNSDGSSQPLCGGRFGMLVDPRLPLSPPLSAMLARKGPALWYQSAQLASHVSNEFSLESFSRRVGLVLSQLNFL